MLQSLNFKLKFKVWSVLKVINWITKVSLTIIIRNSVPYSSLLFAIRNLLYYIFNYIGVAQSIYWNMRCVIRTYIELFVVVKLNLYLSFNIMTKIWMSLNEWKAPWDFRKSPNTMYNSLASKQVWHAKSNSTCFE